MTFSFWIQLENAIADKMRRAFAIVALPMGELPLNCIAVLCHPPWDTLQESVARCKLLFYNCDKHFAEAKKATSQLVSWERLASPRLWLPKPVGL